MRYSISPSDLHEVSAHNEAVLFEVAIVYNSMEAMI